MADPFFSDVSLLLHLNGTEGQTTFSDSGPIAHAVTAVGSGSITTTQSVFGGASLLNPTGTNGLSVPHHASLDFEAGDFTIEFRVRFSSSDASNGFVISKGTGAIPPWGFYKSFGTAPQLVFFASSNGTSFDIANAVVMVDNFAANTWYAMAITRQGSTWRFYVDGVKISEFTSSATLFADTTAFRTWAPLSAHNSFVDELRLTKGVARYTGASYTLDAEEFSDENGTAAPAFEQMTALGGGAAGGTAFFATMSAEGFAPPSAAVTFSVMTALSTPPPFGEGTFEVATATGDGVAGSVASGASAFAAATAAATAPPGAAATFELATATGDGIGGSAASAAALFRDMQASGDATAGSVAEGAPTFEAMLGEGLTDVYAAAAFEAMAAEGTGLTGTTAYADVSFAALTANVSHEGGSLATGEAAFRSMLAAGEGVQPTFAVGTAVFRALRAAGAGSSAGYATGAAQFAKMYADGIAYQATVAVGDGKFELLVASARGAAASAGDYRTWSINVANEALTEYQNHGFDSYAEFGGRAYGAGPGGVYALDGNTDAGANIDWTLRTGMLDNSKRGKEATLSRLEEIILAARFNGPIRVRVWTDDTTFYEYNLTNHRANVIHQVRAKLGKGLRSRFYRVQLFGTNNTRAEISRMELPMVNLKRRLG